MNPTSLWWYGAALAVPVDVPLEPTGVILGDNYGVCAGDIDGDGWTDLVAGTTRTAWHNDAGAGWTSEPLAGLDAVPYQYNGSLADFDRDGLPEFVNETRSACMQLLDDSSSGWADLTASLGDPVCGSSETLAWGDIDGDGLLDLIVPMYEGNVFFHGTTAGFERIRVGLDNETDVYPEGTQLADVDEDGDLDLFVDGVLYRNTSTAGAPSFEASSFVESGLAQWSDEGAMFVDLDLDGDFDLVLMGVSPAGPSARLNRGDGTFAEAPALFATGAYSLLGLSSADWDADGDPDFTTDALFWRNDLMETGTVGLTLVGWSPTLIEMDPAWADLDRDGDLDAGLALWGGTTEIYTNTTFTPATPLAERNTVRVRVVSDELAVPAGVETEFGAEVELIAADGSGRRYVQHVASGHGYLNQNDYVLTFAVPDGAPFDLAVDFPMTSDAGRWRVDGRVNGALVGLDLAQLEERQIDVFRSGAVQIDGQRYAADGPVEPRLWAAGGGLAVAVKGAPLPSPSAAAGRWVGLVLRPAQTVHARELVVDGTPGPAVACGDGGNVLVWDTTDAPALVTAATIPARAGNDRHTAPVDVVLEAGREYRVVARVDALRRTAFVGPVDLGGVSADGGFVLTADADPCAGAAAAAAPVDASALYLTALTSAVVAAPPTDTGGTTIPTDPTDTGGGSTTNPDDPPPAGEEPSGCGCWTGGTRGVGALWLSFAFVRRRRAER